MSTQICRHMYKNDQVMKNNSEQILSKSFTLNGFSLGLGASLLMVGTIIGFISIGKEYYNGLFICLILVIIACLCMFSIECVSIDKQSNKIRLYKDYFFTKIGKWYKLDDYKAIRIIYSLDTPEQAVIDGASTTWEAVQYKYYDVYMISDYGNIIIKQFVDYKKAKSFQKDLAIIIDKPILDSVRMSKNKLNTSHQQRV